MRRKAVSQVSQHVRLVVAMSHGSSYKVPPPGGTMHGRPQKRAIHPRVPSCEQHPSDDEGVDLNSTGPLSDLSSPSRFPSLSIGTRLPSPVTRHPVVSGTALAVMQTRSVNARRRIPLRIYRICDADGVVVIASRLTRILPLPSRWSRAPTRLVDYSPWSDQSVSSV